jgi:hypothetical protein
LFCFGEAQDEASLYAALFDCGQSQFPIWYLGIPINYQSITLAEWKIVEERRLRTKIYSPNIRFYPSVDAH